MKTLRWLALVCSLLIIGLFIAPGPSEAVGPPTLTVNGDPVVFQPTTGTGTTTPGTCSLSDHNAGYTACYQIDTTRTYGGWSVLSISSTNLARLLVADKDGSGNSLDLFTWTGVKLQPVCTTCFSQTLTATYENTFDAAPNPAGNYLFAMRIGGYIVAGNKNNDNTDIGDEVVLSGTGSFPLAANLGMLDTGMIGGPASAVVSFSLSQTQPYQSNSCNTNTVLNQCSPTIMQTLMFVEFNGDTLFLTNSSDGAGGDCVVTPPAVPPSPPFGLPPGPVSPCKAREGKIKSFFNGADSADNRAANQAGASPSTPCETEVCFPPGGGG